MPDSDRLAKLIAHRQEQERKNDKIRVHKNKIENDKLKVLVGHLDWSKGIRGREIATAEEEYVRKLEKIYGRQMSIQQKRIEIEEKKQHKKEAKKQSLETVQVKQEVFEKDRRRQVHGAKQEWTKLFMNKAKSLSGGYRDNDPPRRYYKQKGLVPPERMVTPEVSMEAQANCGGGYRAPSSAEHLYRNSRLPSETSYGVEEPQSHGPLARNKSVRAYSACSGRSDRLMSAFSSTDDDEDNDLDGDLINEVIRVNVRPSTAPNKRRGSDSFKNKKDPKQEVLVTEQVPKLSDINETHSSGIEPEIQTIELQDPNDQTTKQSRPATAAASVRFAGNVSNTERKTRSSLHSSRRRNSMKPPAAMLFHKRDSSAGFGTNRASSAPARSRRGVSKPIMMSNVEQDRIRRKIQEKAECLYSERLKRLALSCMREKGELIPRRIQSANSTREIMFYENYLQNTDAYFRKMAWNALLNPKKNDNEIAMMLGFIERCERGMALADSHQAKVLLLQSTRDSTTKLKENVEEFVQCR